MATRGGRAASYSLLVNQWRRCQFHRPVCVGGATHLYSQVWAATPQVGKTMEWKTNKQYKNKREVQSRRPAHASEWSRIQTPNAPQTKKFKKIIQKQEVKEKYFQKHNINFFFLYPTSSSIATLIVQQDQYIFYNHFKVPLIFFWVFTTVQAKHTLQSAQI